MAELPHEIVFFDGDCGLCHALVKFIVARDAAARIHFAPIHGETFARLVAPRAPSIPDTVVWVDQAGQVVFKSTAVAQVLRRLPQPWPTLGAMLAVIPRPIRDLVYDAIARVRHRLFKRPKSQCSLLPPELAARFLP